MFLYIGRNAVPLLVNDLFGPSYNLLSDINVLQSTMPEVDSLLSIQLRNILAYISETRLSRSLHVQITRQTLDGAEHELMSLLVEDHNNEAQAYHEFLPYLHRQIHLEVFRLLFGLLTRRRVVIVTETKIACGPQSFSHREALFSNEVFLRAQPGLIWRLTLRIAGMISDKVLLAWTVFCTTIFVSTTSKRPKSSEAI
jgi:hypothetical protein